ncbi:MAG: hypothetical protein V4631_21185 [Pseudomonadota bacterium]
MAEAAQMDFDENTTDPAALRALFDKIEAGAVAAPEPAPVAAAAEPVAAPVVAEVKPSAEEVAAAAAAPADKDPDGVATKDGKHIIPYSVLKAERDRAARTEQELRETREQIAALQAAAKPGPGEKVDVAAPDQAAVSDMSAEDLADLKENFPTVYKGVMAMQAQAAALEAKLKPVQDSVRNTEADRAATLAEQVQDAIDATPKLAHIKTTDPEAFEQAKRFDNALKADPAWADKPLADRFAKVIEMVEMTRGAITIPGQAAPPPAQKTAEQLKQEAKAVAAGAVKADKSAVPSSLSDFPAGQHAASDEQEALEGMTPIQLAHKFAAMSPDKLEAYLQNLQ